MAAVTDPVFAAYVLAFGAAAVACFGSLRHVHRVQGADARNGFAALLATSGAWAAAQVGFLLVTGRDLAVAFHLAGLVVGFATVGAWLYFCSAYSGRTMHRDPRYRRAAVAVFAAVVLVKVTNPIHHAYFTTAVTSTPFQHVTIHHTVLHWVAAGLSYALAAVGYFMLFELFDQTSLDTRPLAAVAGLTALPVALNVAGVAVPWLLGMSYEPLGVAAFAVGVLYVFAGRFETVRVTGDVDDPVVFLDESGGVRDYNDNAVRLFPGLDGASGRPLVDVLPRVAAVVDGHDDVLELDDDGDTRYLLVAANPFTVGRTPVGQMLLFSDITDSERQRRELERQNERLSQFASVLSHDLRNPLNVAKGRVDLAREQRDDDNLATVADALDRMESLIEDILALARQGETIGDTERCELDAVAREAWEHVETPNASLDVAGDRSFTADRTRLVQLFENLFRNAVEHGSETVSVTVGATDDGFYVADDGPGVPESERDTVFEAGHSTSENGTGFGLAIVHSIAEAHGWTVSVTDSDDGGARFEIAGVEQSPDQPADEPRTND